MSGSRLSIHHFALGVAFLLSIACGSVSSLAPATEIPPTHTNTPLPTDTAIPTLTPTQTPIPYSIFKKLETFQVSSDGIASMAFSPDGALLAYGDYGNNSVTILNALTGETVKTLDGHTKSVSALAFSPDGKTLASTGTVNLPPGIDGSVRLWDVQTGEQLAVFQTTGASQLTFSPDGTLLAGSITSPVKAGATNQVQVILWNVQSRSQAKSFKDVFNSLSFSPDGSLLATSARDNLIHIFDVKSGEEVMSLSAHTDLISTVSYSPDGKLLASGGWDRTIYLWDATTGDQVNSLTGHEGGVGLVTFSPEGAVLASLGDGFQITRSGGQVNLSFSDEDKLLRFWDIETGQQIGRIEMLNGVGTVAFNTDWTVIATGNSDGTIQLWKVNP